MKKIMSATEARKNFYKLVRAAGKPGAQYTIVLEGEEPVVLMSRSDVEEWMETLEVMSDSQLMADIRRAEKRKDYKEWGEVKKELGW